MRRLDSIVLALVFAASLAGCKGDKQNGSQTGDQMNEMDGELGDLEEEGGGECDYDDPDRTYVAESPEACAAILFECVPGSLIFFDECGCGCEKDPKQQMP